MDIKPGIKKNKTVRLQNDLIVFIESVFGRFVEVAQKLF
jgi:hypothetical protein